MPSFQNINTDAGQGDSLKTAFTKVNANFDLITNGEFVIVSNAQVNSVAGRQGDVVLTVNDIVGAASLGYVNDVFQNAIDGVITQEDLDTAVQTALSNLTDGAPGALDTLKELADAINNDSDFATTISGQIGGLTTSVANNLAYTTNQILAINTKLTSGNITTSGNIGATTITASADFIGNLTGNVVGNLTGNVSGNITGDITGQVSDISNHTTTDLAEGDNLYYTDARVDANIASKTTDDLAEGANLYYTDARWDDRLTTKTTTNLTEGVNLYYTTARWDSRLATKTTSDLAEGANLYYTEARVDANIAGKSTDDLAEGTNLYYTEARVDANIAGKTTDDIAEGTNLYYTDARARDAISVTGSGSYDSATGEINIQGGVTSVNTQTGDVVLTTSHVAEGDNLYYTDDKVGTYLTNNAYATESYVDTAVAGIVGTAPEALNTLNELASALGEDANFATTVSTQLGLKANTADLVTDLSGFTDNTSKYALAVNIPADVSDLTDDNKLLFDGSFASLTDVPTTLAGYGITDTFFDGTWDSLAGKPTFADVALSGSYNDLSDKPVFDLGNFSLSGNTISATNTDGGITISPNGSGEIKLTSNVGIFNTNPGAMLDVGQFIASSTTGTIGVNYGSVIVSHQFADPDLSAKDDRTYLVTNGGAAYLGWKWGTATLDPETGENVPGTSGNDLSSTHGYFGIFNNSFPSSAWIKFSELATANPITVDHKSRFLHSAYQNGGLQTWNGSTVGDTLYRSDEPAGARFYATQKITTRSPSTSPTDNWTEIGHTVLTQYQTDHQNANVSRRDRIRASAIGAELKLIGENWEGSDYFPTLAGNSGSFKILGKGNVGNVYGTTSFTTIYNTDNGVLNVSNTAGRGVVGAYHGQVAVDVSDPEAGGDSYAEIAALFTGRITATNNPDSFGPNATIGSAIGLYLPHYTGFSWAPSASNLTGTKYSVYSEDPDTVMLHKGDIVLRPGGQIRAQSPDGLDWVDINGFRFNNGTPQNGDPERRGILDPFNTGNTLLYTMGNWQMEAGKNIRIDAGLNMGGEGSTVTIIAGVGTADDPFSMEGPGRDGGDVNIWGGDAESAQESQGLGGDIRLTGGLGSTGGNVYLTGGDDPSTNTNYGEVFLTSGSNTLKFSRTGAVVFPDATEQTTAWTGTVSYNDLTDKPANPTITDALQLPVLTAEPTPAEGMIAMADGTLWDPAGTGLTALVAYVGGGWRVLASGSGA